MATSATGLLTLTMIPTPSSSMKLKKQQTTMTTTIECSSRPQKKATAHHMKTRPKKTQPWDKNRRGPTPYPPLPPLPADWTLVEPGSAAAAIDVGGEEEEVQVVAVA